MNVDDNCIICTINLNNCLLECGHIFCNECVSKIDRKYCPLCKREYKCSLQLPDTDYMVFEDDNNYFKGRFVFKNHLNITDVLFVPKTRNLYRYICWRYVTFWRNNKQLMFGGNPKYCQVCYEPALYKNKLLRIYYSILPLTKATVVDAAVSIILLYVISYHQEEGKKENFYYEMDDKLLAKFSPMNITYHFFLNCCYTKKSETSSENRTTPISNLIKNNILQMECFDSHDFLTHLESHPTGNIGNATVPQICKCGKFKQKITENIVSYNGGEKGRNNNQRFLIGSSNQSSTDQFNGKCKSYNDERLATVAKLIKQQEERIEEETDTESHNFLLDDYYSSCLCCNNMILHKNYSFFNTWKSVLKNHSQNFNNETLIKIALKELEVDGNVPDFLKCSDAYNTILEHEHGNMSCLINKRRFIPFFSLFPDLKRHLANDYVQEIHDRYIYHRHDLHCVELMLLSILYNISIYSKNNNHSYGSKRQLSMYCKKIKLAHEIWI